MKRWQDDAACRSLPSEWWIEAPTPEDHRLDWDKAVTAIEICNRCPVQAECLQFALDFEAQMKPRERWGISGGLTPVQRAKVAAKQPRKKRLPKSVRGPR